MGRSEFPKTEILALRQRLGPGRVSPRERGGPAFYSRRRRRRRPGPARRPLPAPGRDSHPVPATARPRSPGEGLAATGRAGGGPGRAGAGGGIAGSPAGCSRAHGDTPHRAVGPRALGFPPGGRPGLRAAPHHLPGRARRRLGGEGGGPVGVAAGAAAGPGRLGLAGGWWYKGRVGDTVAVGGSFLFLSRFFVVWVFFNLCGEIRGGPRSPFTWL